MCVPLCQQKIAQTLNRRKFLKSAGLVAAAAVAGGTASTVAQAQTRTPTPKPTVQTPPPISPVSFFGRVVDLTHTLGEEFPTFSGEPQLTMEPLTTLAEDGYTVSRWVLDEHTGTHMDAPFHFSEMDTADQIPIGNLIGPLAVIDIRAKAEENPDAELTPDDIAAWEDTYGELPPGCIVAMNSGWDEFVTSEKFRNADDDGVMHFPGFHLEAVELLLERQDIKGLFVDTLSLDFGMSADFAVHYSWLPANKWGVECVANLGLLPPIGATAIIGGPKIAGASGGPSRVIALV